MSEETPSAVGQTPAGEAPGADGEATSRQAPGATGPTTSDQPTSADSQSTGGQAPSAGGPTSSSEKAELARIEAVYEAGDFRAVNQLAGGLAERSSDAELKERARTLASRVQIDPFVLWVWAGTTLLVFGLVYAFVLR